MSTDNADVTPITDAPSLRQEAADRAELEASRAALEPLLREILLELEDDDLAALARISQRNKVLSDSPDA